MSLSGCKDVDLSAVLEVFTEVHQAKGSCHERKGLGMAQEFCMLAATVPGGAHQPAHLPVPW